MEETVTVPAEDLAQALVRELREECGIDDVAVGGPAVTVAERREERDSDAVFEMTSHYFRCATGSEPRPHRVDLSASELGPSGRGRRTGFRGARAQVERRMDTR